MDLRAWRDILSSPRNGRPETVALAGGFVCKLTLSERNVWHDHVVVIPAYQEWERIGLLLNTATISADEAAGFIDRYIALERELYQIGKDWYAALVANDPKEGA